MFPMRKSSGMKGFAQNWVDTGSDRQRALRFRAEAVEARWVGRGRMGFKASPEGDWMGHGL